MKVVHESRQLTDNRKTTDLAPTPCRRRASGTVTAVYFERRRSLEALVTGDQLRELRADHKSTDLAPTP
jgi:hypothetical protein